MKFEFNPWLQEAIYNHAQEMACIEAKRQEGGDNDGHFFAYDYKSGGYGYGDNPNPHYGTFKFEVLTRINGNEKKYIIELEVRDVVKDYVNGSD